MNSSRVLGARFAPHLFFIRSLFGGKDLQVTSAVDKHAERGVTPVTAWEATLRQVFDREGIATVDKKGQMSHPFEGDWLCHQVPLEASAA